MVEVLLVAIILLLLLLTYFTVKRGPSSDSPFQEIRGLLVESEKSISRVESNLKAEFGNNRDELSRNLRENREELLKSINSFQEIVQTSLRDNRQELSRALKSFEDTFNANVRTFNDFQKQKFDSLTLKLNELTSGIQVQLEKVANTVEARLKTMQEDNNTKLEKMRETVDEKLDKTLEHRLGQTFKHVSERLELVHKGLGEMQTLAVGVGDLKKVIANVKSRGVMGEYQLAAILEQIMAPDQYQKNVKPKPNSSESVEYAIKLPGKADSSEVVWLPIDSKFPVEIYTELIDSYDKGDTVAIDTSRKQLNSKIRTFAKDIRDKYVDPPNTTDFAIMFLPFEGLYAEVTRIPGLMESLQRDFKISVTGPSNLAAFLNSLQMGFRTLAIEKRSSEVWQLLGAVKTEFSHFGAILDKTKRKLDEASNVIDSAGVRTRAIERKLRDVQELPQHEVSKFIDDSIVTLDFDSTQEPNSANDGQPEPL